MFWSNDVRDGRRVLVAVDRHLPPYDVPRPNIHFSETEVETPPTTIEPVPDEPLTRGQAREIIRQLVNEANAQNPRLRRELALQKVAEDFKDYRAAGGTCTIAEYSDLHFDEIESQQFLRRLARRVGDGGRTSRAIAQATEDFLALKEAGHLRDASAEDYIDAALEQHHANERQRALEEIT